MRGSKLAWGRGRISPPATECAVPKVALTSCAVRLLSLMMPRDRLVKIDRKIVLHGRYFTFRMAEAVILRDLLGETLHRIE